MSQRIIILTIFPEIFSGFVASSLIEKAVSRELISFRFINPRDFAEPPHFQVDDTPYGGGAGMVMKAEPLARATVAAKSEAPSAPVVLLSPRGNPFRQEIARAFSGYHEVIYVCGRYEGIDERYIESYVDQEISLGDFVLMGGEVASMAIIEASVRLIEGVVGNAESIVEESFAETPYRLEAPHYTRPAEFEGKSVPEVLLSGNHARIMEWRQAKSREITHARRPELLRSPSNRERGTQ